MKLSIILLVFVVYLQGKSDALYTPPLTRSGEGPLRNILIPSNLLADFEYEPIKAGYRYRYLLFDGTRREEIGFITNPKELSEGVLAMEQSDRGSTRPMTNDKSRKLSPKALQGLAG